MKVQFSLALLSAAASASSGTGTQERLDFLSFIATNGKNYDNPEDMEMRLGIYHQNKEAVEDLNRNNVGVSFEMNWSSDMTEDEFNQHLGVRNDQANQADDETPVQVWHGGRHLDDTNYSKNWATLGRVGPVKNQGGCGSCWAFAATTCQEGMQGIKDNNMPTRLSEQEGVDCSEQSHGCGGGWMSHYWKFSKGEYQYPAGSQSNGDYTYEAATRACRNQDNKQVVSTAASWGSFPKGNNQNMQMMEHLHNTGPMTIAVGAGNSCWRFYKTGILSAANNCPTNIDHGVVIVGLYQPGGDDNDDNDDDDNDDDDDDDDDDNFDQEYTCRKARRSERNNGECNGDDEEIQPNQGDRWSNRLCCQWTDVEGGRRLNRRNRNRDRDNNNNNSNDSDNNSDGVGNGAYWIVQNSWGTGWGDQGFIKLAVETGDGVSGMNKHVNFMAVE